MDRSIRVRSEHPKERNCYENISKKENKKTIEWLAPDLATEVCKSNAI